MAGPLASQREPSDAEVSTECCLVRARSVIRSDTEARGVPFEPEDESSPDTAALDRMSDIEEGWGRHIRPGFDKHINSSFLGIGYNTDANDHKFRSLQA
jgi:hypothetical protein